MVIFLHKLYQKNLKWIKNVILKRYYDLRTNNYVITKDLPYVKLVDNFDAKYSVIFHFYI